MLFHAEVDAEQVGQMSRVFRDELVRAGVSAAELVEGVEGFRCHGAALREVGLAFFRRFAVSSGT